jgi:glyoxylase-like metal-dependent hydrolase (beta-lactamase superfamily II)
MIVSTITVGPFAENCHLLVDDDSRAAVLVDPGDEGPRIVAAVRSAGVALQAIWLTHAHLDHIGGIAAVLREWTVPVHLHPLDRPLYDRGAQQAAAYGIPFESPPAPDHELAEGDRLAIGEHTFTVLHLPGHAPGHVAFLGNGLLFSGDVLFAGSVGRTDLPLSNPAQLERSLARLASLPPETLVHAGHGPNTTIGAEVQTNPFLTGVARVARR